MWWWDGVDGESAWSTLALIPALAVRITAPVAAAFANPPPPSTLADRSALLPLTGWPVKIESRRSSGLCRTEAVNSGSGRHAAAAWR